MTESSDPAGRILVVEDDPSISLGLRIALEREGYAVTLAEDGLDGLQHARSASWDLIILDVMLPRLNGYEFLSRLGEEVRTKPVMVLSARTEDEDKVIGLDLGAEDYVTKPFSVPELLARVRAILRRRREKPPTVFEFGDVLVDANKHEVYRAGEKIDLTQTEFDVLMTLVRAGGSARSRAQIFTSVWGEEHHGTHRTIDNFVAQLRGKLEEDPAAPLLLLTVRGVGYRLAFT